MTPENALDHWPIKGTILPIPDGGLINRTWQVGDPPQAVLQWVNPIFDPQIHLDMAAITQRLAAAGLAVPRLIKTATQDLWIPDDSPEGGCWRLMTYLPGITLHRLNNPQQARQAGDLVGRFHAALAQWEYCFQAPRRNIHDTPNRMAELQAALEGADGHPLEGQCRELGQQVLHRWAQWDGDLQQPNRICHGDLKISNLRFNTARKLATGLLDLDTLGPMPLVCEMGDAWRSWCNPAMEDAPQDSRFDLELFAASARAWLATAPPLEENEQRGLVPGIERICLELAARFCADALLNTYFREDRERFPQPGAHNLQKAYGQWSLAQSAHQQRSACQAVINAGIKNSRPQNTNLKKSHAS